MDGLWYLYKVFLKGWNITDNPDKPWWIDVFRAKSIFKINEIG
jgi:hypothetical protein